MALVALIAFTSAAHGGLINGSINFSSGPGGGVVLQDSLGNDTTNLLAVTGIKSWLFAEVEEGTGSFDGVPDGSAVTFAQPWVFNPSTPKTPLWSIAGPDNFAFNLLTATVVRQSGSFLAIKGTGTLTSTNYSATAGTWYFTTQGDEAEGKFSWSSSTAAVPDAGTTLALLGGSLLGLCGLRRKLRPQ